jgi:hypothetical protein
VVSKAGIVAALAASLLSGCSAQGSADSPAPPGPLALAIEAPIPPGTEEYVCRYFVVSESGFDVSGFEQRLDPSSHHLLLWQTTLEPSDVADQLDSVIRHCDTDLERHAAISGMLYGAQPGNATLRYPPGAALRLDPGLVVMLEHHVVNTGTSELFSHAEIDLLPSGREPRAEAGLLHFYDWAIHVPARSTGQTRMRCAIAEPLELVFVHGHMHERGRGFRAWVDRGGETLPLLDTPDWNRPTESLSPPFALLAGDAVEFECRYENPDAIDVGQGTSARRDEMCSLTAGYVAGSGERMDAFSEACALAGSGVVGHGSLDCVGIEGCIASAIESTAAPEARVREAQSCFLQGCPKKTIPFAELAICRAEQCREACNPSIESAGFVAKPADAGACTGCLSEYCRAEAALCAVSVCAE